ncbi:MAG: glutamate--cysteine ligase, partial [Comamonas sp.]|nr:glutamate--cysteine ligase [Comamonas sp.]
DFMTAQSAKARDALLAMPWSAAQQTRFEQMSEASVAAQAALEAADTLTFEEWRQRYMDPASLL